MTTSIPIFEGLALSHAAICSDYGGQDISAGLRKLLADRDIRVDLSVATYLKERMSFVHGTFQGQPPLQEEFKTFGLPDGTEVTVDSRIFSECSSGLFGRKAYNSGGLAGQVCESLTLCDDTIRRELAQNIIIAGGTSMLPGTV